jgi:hypothetical protein
VAMARQMLSVGLFPFIPALDFMLFIYRPGITEAVIKEYSMEWLRRCDAVLDISKGKRSGGVLAELSEAASRGIPTFTSLGAILNVNHVQEVANERASEANGQGDGGQKEDGRVHDSVPELPDANGGC